MTVMTVFFGKSYGEMFCMGEGRIHKYIAPTESFLKKYSHYSQAVRICPIQLRKGRNGELDALGSDCTRSICSQVTSQAANKTDSGRRTQYSTVLKAITLMFLLNSIEERPSK